MKQTVIENPIINSPFREPSRHYLFDDDGITSQVVEGRRRSEHFVPVPRPRSRGPRQPRLQADWTADRSEPNPLVNDIRPRVALWRRGGYQGVTNTTRRLLEHWQRADREPPLFFCQIEAAETAIYIAEVAPRYGDRWIAERLRAANEAANPLLDRLALKMATGSGKTVVMAMLVAWQALNRAAEARSGLYSDAFLIVTPGITIRDRLRVLLPSDPQNYYQRFDLVPADLRDALGQAKIVITNYHAFKPRETGDGSRLTKEILAAGRGAAGRGAAGRAEGARTSAFTETPGQMVRRVCRELGTRRNIVVINDEAHHCYRHRPEDSEAETRLTGDERREAERREEAARVWISGLEAVRAKIGTRAVFDLSATPFFLRGSGYAEGTLFPWVVSDFALIDAIESGIVKVPRVPVADDAMVGEQPTYRDLWLRIRDALPRAGRRTQAVTGDPVLPAELEGALQSLYSNYVRYYQAWERVADARARELTPPVFIVVCNNTNVSKLVYDYIAGYDKTLPGGETAAVPGHLDLFSNVTTDGSGRWLQRPNTILIDSEQLESGEAMSREFKAAAAREIEEFKAEYRVRFPGRDADNLTDEDLLREVMNTVGKPGRLGEQVRCVVSVSMLTEGWDANTVTHILGVRAFGTQLLCEQVVGRGLRRVGYEADADGLFSPEYAEVYGVPFSFIPVAGSTPEPQPGPTPTRVRALEERAASEITFPRVAGYRFALAQQPLEPAFTEDSRLTLSTADLATWTENAPIVGERSVHTLDDLKARREQEVAYLLAKLVLERYFRADGLGPDAGGRVAGGPPDAGQPPGAGGHGFSAEVQAWRFPEVLAIARAWLADWVTFKDHTFPQLLLLTQLAYDAADRIYRAIAAGTPGERTLLPILEPYNTVGSTAYADFNTIRPVFATRPDRCHLNYVVADTTSWEQHLAVTLEGMPEVLSYVKNDHLGFTIPYTLDGVERRYTPDFIVRLDDGRGPADPLNLIVEVSGAERRDKEAKVATARQLWVPAVNNHGGLGRWGFLEVEDPWNAQTILRASINRMG